MEERRLYPRFNCPIDKFCGFRLEGENDFIGNVVNVSRHGVTLSTTRQLTNDAIINLNLNYTDIQKQIPSSVKIIWAKSGKVLHTYGAQFLDIKAEDKIELMENFYENWKKKTTDQQRMSSPQASNKTWLSETK